MAQLKHGTLTHNSKLILKELINNPEGLRAKSLQKILGIPRRSIYNNLNRLKGLKLVQNIHPIWKLCQIQSTPLKMAQLLKSNKIQLHDFSFTIKLIRKPFWWDKRENKLMRLKEFTFKPIRWGNQKYQQIAKDNFIIQAFSNSMIFINNKHYWGNDPYDCFIQATNDFLLMFKFICEMFNFDFSMDGIPMFSVRTQHYVKLRDIIAKRCKKHKNMFKVSIDGKLRAWVDLSEPFGMEFGNKENAVEDTHKYTKFVEDIIAHESPLPSEAFNMIQEVTKNQMVHAENMRSHVGAVKELKEAVIDLRKEIKNLRKTKGI